MLDPGRTRRREPGEDRAGALLLEGRELGERELRPGLDIALPRLDDTELAVDPVALGRDDYVRRVADARLEVERGLDLRARDASRGEESDRDDA